MFSPDGHWWWNGREWRPAAEASVQRRTGPRWGLIILVATAALFGLLICGPIVLVLANRPSQVVSAGSVAPGARAPACSPEPCADADGFTVYVDSVEWSYTPSAFFKAEPGNQFARVTVRFENRGSSERHADPYNFVLKDQQGVKHALTYAGDGWLAVNLSPGARFGPRSIDFQVTSGSRAGTLVWTPDSRDHEMRLTG